MTAFAKRSNESSVKAVLELITNICEHTERSDLEVLEEMVFKGGRKHYRKPVFTVVDYATQGHAYKDFIRNISPGGVYIETPMPFSVGQELSLTFALPTYEKHIKISGEIVRVDSQGIGVKFKAAT
jgi:hypothetical protein